MANQESFFINLGSMTQAIKAEKILKAQEVECTVGKRANTSDGGCSWGVFVKDACRQTTVNILRTNAVNV
jgi:hypothetical protein